MDVDGRLGLRFEEAIVDIIIQMVRLVAFSASNGQFIRLFAQSHSSGGSHKGGASHLVPVEADCSHL